eukprot:tig00020685_g12933.t1
MHVNILIDAGAPPLTGTAARQDSALEFRGAGPLQLLRSIADDVDPPCRSVSPSGSSSSDGSASDETDRELEAAAGRAAGPRPRLGSLPCDWALATPPTPRTSRSRSAAGSGAARRKSSREGGARSSSVLSVLAAAASAASPAVVSDSRPSAAPEASPALALPAGSVPLNCLPFDVDAAPSPPPGPPTAGALAMGARPWSKRRASMPLPPPPPPLVVDLDGLEDGLDREEGGAGFGRSLLRSLSGAVRLGRRGSSSGPSSAARPLGLNFVGYEAFHLCLHRCLTPARSTWVYPDARRLAADNWAVDARGADSMPREAFERALYGAAAAWAGDAGACKVAPALRLLAAETGLGDLTAAFLSCLAHALLAPAPPPAPGAPPAPPRLRLWHEVEVGACSPGRALQHLGSLRRHSPRIRSLDAASFQKPAPAAPAAPAAAAAPQAKPPAAPAAGAPAGLEALGPIQGAVALRRHALHNRLERLAAARGRRPSDDAAAGTALAGAQ